MSNARLRRPAGYRRNYVEPGITGSGVARDRLFCASAIKLSGSASSALGWFYPFDWAFVGFLKPLSGKGQPPVLGGRLMPPLTASLGPLDDRVRNGPDMAYSVWKTDADDLRERIDSNRSARGTTDTDVIPLTVDALRECGWLD